MGSSWGIYVHIPFCRQKCYYCDFPSFAGREDRMCSYAEAVCREFERTAASLDRKAKAGTVYVGGGTPTVLPGRLLQKILEEMHRCLPIEETAEFTVEANPGTVDQDVLLELKAAGVNRISFGVQSFSDILLKRIGRIHSSEDAVTAVRAARKAGFHNISLDLMYGLPGQSMGELEDSIRTAMELEPEHISIYGLQLEQGTVLESLHRKGKLELPSEEQAEAMYDFMTEYLPAHGYERYEISNFARPGYESRHNLGYWKDVPYLGFGAAAHSYWENQRWNHPPDLDEYIADVNQGRELRRNLELLTEEISMEEFCFLSLRTTEGISEDAFQRKFRCRIGEVYQPVIDRLTGKGLLEEVREHIRLTKQGMKFGNVVFREFML